MEDPELASLYFPPVEPPTVYFEKSGFVVTKFGNKISKKSVLCGSDKICVRGKTIVEAKSVLRGDLAVVNIGASCIVGERVVIRSPDQRFKGGLVLIPIVIGDYVIIEKDSIVQAASIGSHVHIGKDCIIGKRCIISNCCRILDGTVLTAGTVVPPFSVYGGCPGKCVGSLSESYSKTVKDMSDTYYKHFIKK